MTCAETRRQLPAPESGAAAAVAEHLHECVPCRAESDALKEVDRRLQRLGQGRLDGLTAAAPALDRQLQEQLGLLQPAQPAQPRARLLALAVLGLLLALVAAFLLRGR